jgi:phytoene dehydrogenase-like protein
MDRNSGSGRRVVIIGAGIAGLCAAVYARKSGYDVTLLEKHDTPGGLATSWRRGEYTFETCLHWLLGSAPGAPLHDHWREVFDIDALAFIQPPLYARIEDAQNGHLTVLSNVDRMEAVLIADAPQDEREIRRLADAVRRLSHFEIPDPSDSWPHSLLTLLKAVPDLPLLHEWSGISLRELGARFTHPLLRAFFSEGSSPELSALAFVFSLAWMNAGNAGYPIGGSRAVIGGIAKRFAELGGRIRYGAMVETILETDGVANGVRLVGGETIAADWVISAADGHATIYDLLGGKYRDAEIDEAYRTLKPFPSYVQVSLGIEKDLSDWPGFLVRQLDTPLAVDPETRLSQLSFRVFHFDPTFAPKGKTAVTCFLPTRNFAYWSWLNRHDHARYAAEKARVAESVIGVLEARAPGIRDRVAVIDVATPETVIRATGNWQGSMEGWLLLPGADYKPLRNTLPGLSRFLMVGQWVMPGGGLPSGLLTARAALKALCREDNVAFLAGA